MQTINSRWMTGLIVIVMVLSTAPVFASVGGASCAGFAGDLTVHVKVSNSDKSTDAFNMNVMVTGKDKQPVNTSSSGGSGGGCFTSSASGSGGVTTGVVLVMAVLGMVLGAVRSRRY